MNTDSAFLNLNGYYVSLNERKERFGSPLKSLVLIISIDNQDQLNLLN